MEEGKKADAAACADDVRRCDACASCQEGVRYICWIGSALWNFLG